MGELYIYLSILDSGLWILSLISMDPMEQDEEDMRRKEEETQRDLEETIGLIDFIADRDLSGRGRIVRPSAKQMKEVQGIGASLRIRDGKNRKLGTDNSTAHSYEPQKLSEFDIYSVPRIHIMSGDVNKREPDGILWKTSRRHLILFNDVLLVTLEGGASSHFDLQQVLWIKDMKINNLTYDENEDPTAFEIIMNCGSKRPYASFIFTCDSIDNKQAWVTEITHTIFGFLRESRASKKLGWFNEVALGTLHSAAHTGNLLVLRKHLRLLDKSSKRALLDAPDESGMAPIHWAAIKGNEACLRILLEKGADVDCLNGGLNSPLLLAAAFGHDTLARILIEKGADPFVRNLRDRDAVFMAVVYGHASKGLPWTLQLLDSKGMDLNQVDSLGATPLHVCAEKNLARPVRMLVDAGAHVNVKHQKTGLTPLQMACSQKSPDVETIRSFLDKGAYANWRDFQGRTAFELVINVHNSKKPSVPRSTTASSSSADDYDMSERPSTIDSGDTKWRPMEETIERVGNWAVRALPVILEIVKKGGRFDPRHLEGLRPSFREAVQLARTEWAEKKEGAHFTEFVLAREQAGEDLRLRKESWMRDDAFHSCQLCAEEFGLKNRRHHCRACGSLACDFCSTKRLRLTVIDEHVKEPKKGDSGEPADSRERVCDGCFNRLMHEASQPSPDHPRVRELKLCAMELMESIGDLVEALDDPRGDPTGVNAALRLAGLGGGGDGVDRPLSHPLTSGSRALSERQVAGTPPRWTMRRQGSAPSSLHGGDGGREHTHVRH